MKKIIFKLCYFVVLIFNFGCLSNNIKDPEYHTDIIYDEDMNVLDWGLSGQSTPDGKYFYYGSVTLYSEDGCSRDFPCYLGKNGLESGCRGVVNIGKFYNLDRNEWVNINGVRYKASNTID